MLLIGVPADRKQIGPHPFQAVGEKYLRALIDAAGVLPLPIPCMPGIRLDAVLDRIDGLFLTGSPSNIEPQHYGETSWEGNPHDPARDATTLNLLPLAIERRMPVLAVCRGLQEVNVALGGSLLQKVHETPGFNDHREDKTAELDVQYAPAHEVLLAQGGRLRAIAAAERAKVNSLHGQGIGRLGRGLVAEATAMDGLIEAVRLDDPQRFVLAVQWHPEWRVLENPFYTGLFQAFAAACADYAETRIRR